MQHGDPANQQAKEWFEVLFVLCSFFLMLYGGFKFQWSCCEGGAQLFPSMDLHNHTLSLLLSSYS